MIVQELFTEAVASIELDDTLALAGELMWKHDCGVLPVKDVDGRPVGMITDRDCFMALSTRSRPASDIVVREVISGKLFDCEPGQDISDALGTMRQYKVRRLPVVDGEGRLLGILSLNDIALAARPGETTGGGGVSLEEVGLALKAISESHVVRKPEVSPGTPT